MQAFRNLEAQGFAPRLRVAEFKERAIGLRHDLIIRREEIARGAAAEAAVAQRLAELDTTFRREALDAFKEADATARVRREELTIAQDRNRRTLLTVPAAGIV
ncbi:MAG: hypothetical protein NW203_14355 [Hyphomonadaceae bacterium]|nr:hypothetical protein [Hyphomonadaceae bacterium]